MAIFARFSRNLRAVKNKMKGVDYPASTGLMIELAAHLRAPADMSDTEFLQQTFALDRRVAVITGASSGIGAHLATTLARAGCAVALAARRKEKLESLAASIGKHGGDALSVVMDVNDRQSVQSAFERIVDHFGNVDILLNNAGIADSQTFLEMTEQAWSRVLETDLSAVWRVGQVAAQRMVSQKTGGSIINIASILGLAVRPNLANYNAAKAGVIHLTKTMALELGREGVRVNALAPGYFVTELNREFLDSERGREYLAELLPQRAGELRELDGATLLLASDAGSYLNGSILTVDGGTILGHM